MSENKNPPRDLRGLSQSEIEELSRDLREKIIDAVSKNGGHLSSNLGIVETTVALHRVFNFPRDTLIFDVGHQAYAHKLLTGRDDRFDTLRRYGGISGFTNRGESEYDFVTAGHSGAALSTALGKAQANRLCGSDAFTVAVIGDGSFTNGETFEALNMCASNEKLRLLIVLNDNEMSISKNVGGVSKYFSRVRSSRKYYDFKRGTENFLSKIPLIGWPIAVGLKKIKDFFKRMVVGVNFFDTLGINFLGTVNGGDEKRLEEVFNEAKRRASCCIVHVITKKGNGYAPAESRPDLYHSVAPFDKDVGLAEKSGGFSEKFGEYMCSLAESDEKLVAVSAAMTDGTGLLGFAKKYPDRFFDVGIAEEHATTFCAGLALGGYKPVFAVYSTFAQRIFDQLVHDVSLQKAHVVFAIDRAGLVAGDGVTHHGLFDVSLMSAVPDMEIYAPCTYAELEKTLKYALDASGPVAVRYPKGAEIDCGDFHGENALSDSDASRDVVIITYSRLTKNAVEAEKLLGGAKTVKLLRLFPIDFDELDKHIDGAKLIYVLEEGIRSGGVGEKIAARYGDRVFVRAADGFVPHGDLASLDDLLGFTPEKIAGEIRELTK
ncbi:MAG: 1-deoxy-D-xylulose-5-phosphate synthase [Clostridia bacterium]|nr:1-deoxy-D-xylulose-5-phosphate synthase [Clostridia bacterium]